MMRGFGIRCVSTILDLDLDPPELHLLKGEHEDGVRGLNRSNCGRRWRMEDVELKRWLIETGGTEV